jgi:hypothetical protein
MIVLDLSILNQKGTPMFNSDTFANRPAFGIVGRIFISTDTKEFFRDTGTSWELIGGPGSGTITGSGAAGQVTYFTGASSVAGSNNLFWNSTNNRLGIGTTNPAARLHVDDGAGAALFIGLGTYNYYRAFSHIWQNLNGVTDTMTISSAGNLLLGTSTDLGQRLQVSGDALINFVNQYTAITSGDGLFLKCPSTSANGVIGLTGAGMILQGRDGTTTAFPLILQPYGENVLIGTTVNTGYKVQITSSTADNQLNVWGASAPSIRIDNAGSAATQRFVIGLATATNNFIQGSAAGQFCISTQSAGAMLFGMWQTTNATEAMRISTANNLMVGSSTDNGNRFQVTGDSTFSRYVTIGNRLTLNGSGTSEIYTTDASGLYLTAVTNGGMYIASENAFIFRKATSPFTEYMRIKSTGVINLSNVPNSSVGLSSGDIYQTAGVLNIVP